MAKRGLGGQLPPDLCILSEIQGLWLELKPAEWPIAIQIGRFARTAAGVLQGKRYDLWGILWQLPPGRYHNPSGPPRFCGRLKSGCLNCDSLDFRIALMDSNPAHPLILCILIQTRSRPDRLCNRPSRRRCNPGGCPVFLDGDIPGRRAHESRGFRRARRLFAPAPSPLRNS